MEWGRVTNKHLVITLTFWERKSCREDSFAERGGDCDTPGNSGVERGEGGEYLADVGFINGNDICEDKGERCGKAFWESLPCLYKHIGWSTGHFSRIGYNSDPLNAKKVDCSKLM